MAYPYSANLPVLLTDPLGLYVLSDTCKREPWEPLIQNQMRAVGERILDRFLDCLDEECVNYTREYFEDAFSADQPPIKIWCGSNPPCRARGAVQGGVLCGYADGYGIRLCDSTLNDHACDAPFVVCTIVHELVHIIIREPTEHNPRVRKCWPHNICPESGKEW